MAQLSQFARRPGGGAPATTYRSGGGAIPVGAKASARAWQKADAAVAPGRVADYQAGIASRSPKGQWSAERFPSYKPMDTAEYNAAAANMAGQQRAANVAQAKASGSFDAQRDRYNLLNRTTQMDTAGDIKPYGSWVQGTGGGQVHQTPKLTTTPAPGGGATPSGTNFQPPASGSTLVSPSPWKGIPYAPPDQRAAPPTMYGGATQKPRKEGRIEGMPASQYFARSAQQQGRANQYADETGRLTPYGFRRFASNYPTYVGGTAKMDAGDSAPEMNQSAPMAPFGMARHKPQVAPTPARPPARPRSAAANWGVYRGPTLGY